MLKLNMDPYQQIKYTNYSSVDQICTFTKIQRDTTILCFTSTRQEKGIFFKPEHKSLKL